MTRYDDWDARLQLKLAEFRTRRFEWGQHDCCLAVCSLVEAMSGVDPGTDFRGQYTSSLGAKRVVRALTGLKKLDILTLSAVLAKAYGMVPLNSNDVQRGDVVVLGPPHPPALGLCVGEMTYFAGLWGASYVPNDRLIAAWRF